MKRNWLITGGCGFIGTNLISRILSHDRSANIRVLDNLSVGTREDLSAATGFTEVSEAGISAAPSGVELLAGDIRSYATCQAAIKGIDVVVHLAANTGVDPSVKDPFLDMETNVRGTLNMLDASRHGGVGKFVFASSGAPLGEVTPPIHEEKAPRPVSPYGASKLSGEGYCSAYFRTFGVKTVSLRFGNVYGPGSGHKNSIVAKFFKLALSGETLEIYGDGKQTRDFIFIDDLLNAVMLAASADIGGEVFQIATYRETTVNEIAEMIRSLLSKEAGIDVRIRHMSPRLGDVMRNYSDISKARKVLGFEPAYDMEKGLKKTYEYFRSRVC